MSETNGDRKVYPIDNVYYQSSYNIIRCGICGCNWIEHDDISYCSRYRPPAELVSTLTHHKSSVVARNLQSSGQIAPKGDMKS